MTSKYLSGKEILRVAQDDRALNYTFFNNRSCNVPPVINVEHGRELIPGPKATLKCHAAR